MSKEIKSHVMYDSVRVQYVEKFAKGGADPCKKCSFFEGGCHVAPPCSFNTQMYFKVVGIEEHTK